MTEEKPPTNGTKTGNGKPISLHPLAVHRVVKAMVEIPPPLPPKLNGEFAVSTIGNAVTTNQFMDDEMRSNALTINMQPGMRVELTGNPTAVTLRGRTGTVVREDEDEDYVIVELDTPALYRHINGEVEELPEIVVMTDNLRVLRF